MTKPSDFSPAAALEMKDSAAAKESRRARWLLRGVGVAVLALGWAAVSLRDVGTGAFIVDSVVFVAMALYVLPERKADHLAHRYVTRLGESARNAPIILPNHAYIGLRNASATIVARILKYVFVIGRNIGVCRVAWDREPGYVLTLVGSREPQAPEQADVCHVCLRVIAILLVYTNAAGEVKRRSLWPSLWEYSGFERRPSKGTTPNCSVSMFCSNTVAQSEKPLKGPEGRACHKDLANL